jgi:DNA-binding NarL/FixJ family response regulator
MKKSAPIQVAIADDHSIVREGLIAIIHHQSDMKIVAQARNWLEAVEHVLARQPEVAVLDLHMNGMAPVDGVTALSEKCPGTQIVIFSAFGTHEEVYQVVCAGARGYVLKGESGGEDLLACIRAVARGEMWIHPLAAAKLAERMTEPNLTPRETEIVRLMVVGKSNKEIGSALDVTEGTVKVHVNHILAKLRVSGRVEAVMVAMQHGIVRLTEGLPGPARSVRGQNDSVRPRASGEYISKAIASINSTRQLPTKK